MFQFPLQKILFKETIVASRYLIKNLMIWCLEIPAATYKYLQGFQLEGGPLTKPWIFHVRCYL